MSHTRAGMSAYKKASPGTTVEIADGNILPVDGFRRIEVDLDQPGHTTKMVKMDDVADVPGLSRNLLSTIKAVEQWGKPLTYYRNKAVLGFPGEESLVFKFCPRKGLFSAIGARRIPRQEVALGANLTENGLVRIASGTALAMRAGVSRDIMEVHRMLAHPSEDITKNTTEMMGIETTGQWGPYETCFQAKTKRHAVPKKTDERAGVKGQRFFVDVGGPMKHSSLGWNSYVVIFVDDCTRFKVVTFPKKESNTAAALFSLITDYITPQKLSIKCVRTDNGGEFEGRFLARTGPAQHHARAYPARHAAVQRCALTCAWTFTKKGDHPDGGVRRRHQLAAREAVGSGNDFRARRHQQVSHDVNGWG